VNAVASAVYDAIRHEPRLRHVQCVLVLCRDDLVVEQYFRDRRPGDLVNVHSVTKSFLSSLVGIAIRQGSMALTTTVGEVLANRIPPGEQAKAAITVEHLLTMTSGLAAEGKYDIDEIADAGRNLAEGVLQAPLQDAPGTKFSYNNGAAHLLSVMLTASTGMPLTRFAEERLFGPLGVADYRWPADPEGNPLGYGHLELRPRDLVRFGQLYLRQGRVADAAVLDPAWVKAATTAATRGGPPENTPYGYLWWITDQAGKAAYFAGGYGGQYVTVVPELELVVVTTGDVDVLIPSSADPLRLVAESVVPALLP
jgi:CubicO group peptidase (beta-lactamase class C family)